jgi:hypothetical protein
MNEKYEKFMTSERNCQTSPDYVYKKNPAMDFTRRTLPSCTQSTQAKHEERIKQL